MQKVHDEKLDSRLEDAVCKIHSVGADHVFDSDYQKLHSDICLV